ncbi:aldo/keto reductase [Streptomyces europaeiscabiei]|uniref:aldo/keto reductase n=1 Tax=Streptomyces europaeiscabiei TaxID=146819 RepID=UPI0029B03F53|nr:aldo/keto reductase [Streptomyces europaeiscabiei]MDX3691347.1 aldo/keto reductase [Streptomyces europaeiscabiei]
MWYDLIGRTGLRVSELCLGAGTFGVEGWGASREDAARMLDLYTEAGGNFIDTANVYGAGRSEECVGELLAGRRDEFVLATKVSSMTRPGDVNSAGNHRKNLVASLESSLRRLRTDHVDLLWLHTRDAFTPVEEVMRALDDLVRAGKVLYVGASNWPAWEVSRANMLAELRGWSAFAGIQVRYNLLERTVERELLPMAAACDVSVFAWGPLAEGRLTGKYLHGARGRLSVENWAGDDERDTAVVREVTAVAEETGRTPAQVALAWLRGRPEPDAVLPVLGATRPEQLQDTLGVLDLQLDQEHIKRLDTVSEPSLGFPRDFMRNPKFTKGTYGDRWQRLERRGGPGRTVDALL